MSADREPLVLVGWDGSEAAERALGWSASQAKRCGGRVIVVQVISPSTLTPPASALPPDLLEDQRAAVERTLVDTIVHAGRRYGLIPEVEIVPSLQPADALLEASVRHGASLICVGTSGAGGVARALLGSTAERLSRHSRVPVVLVPHVGVY